MSTVPGERPSQPGAIRIIIDAETDESARAIRQHVDSYRHLAHPGLMHVRDVIDDESTARRTTVICEPVAGPVLSDWLASHPDADAVGRTALLRMIASALDTLHTVGLSHGRVDADHVIIGADTTAAVTPPDWQAQVAAGSSDTAEDPIAADRRAFARLAVYVLTGRPVPLTDAGDVDMADLRRQLYAATPLRRRPAFAAAVARTLVAPADALPRNLRRWLDAASAAGAEQTTPAPGSAAGEPAPGGAPAATAARGWGRLPTSLVIIAATGIATAGVAIAAAMLPSAHHAGVLGISTSDPVVAPGPVSSSASWLPASPSCDSTTAVAMPPQAGPRSSFPADPRASVLGADGAIWHTGVLTVTLHNTTDRPVLLTGAVPHRTGYSVSAPAWIFRPVADGRCVAPTAPAGPTRNYALNLDNFLDFRADDAVAADPIGAPLPIPAGQTATLRVAATACAGSYRFVLQFTVVPQGSSTPYAVTFPQPSSGQVSYAVDGLADHTDIYTGTAPGATGQLTGVDPACHGAGR